MTIRRNKISKEEMREHFILEQGSGIPLHQQLFEHLMQYIRTLPPGSVLPSERFLAESLGISRVTVRKALAELAQHGIVESRGRLGTVTRTMESTQTETQPASTIHEMALGLPFLSAPPQVKLLLFENIPAQARYWETVVARYNDASRSCRISLEWLPLSVKAPQFFHFLQQNKVDIFQYAYRAIANQAAQALPEQLQNFCRSRNHLYNLAQNKPETAHLLPFDRSFFITFLNPNLLEICGETGAVGDFTLDHFPQLFNRMHDQLPTGCHVAGRCWDYARFELQMDDPDPLAAIKRFGRRYAGAIKQPKYFLTEQQRPLDSLEKFWAGKLLSLCILTTHYAAMEQHASFTPEICVLRPHIPISPMGLGIHKNSPFPNEAADFLAFLHEPDQQWLLGSIKQTIPPDSGIWRQLARENYHLPAAEADSFFARNCPVNQAQMRHIERCQEFIVHQIRIELKQYLSGELALPEVLRQCRDKWQSSCENERSLLCMQSTAPCP